MRVLLLSLLTISAALAVAPAALAGCTSEGRFLQAPHVDSYAYQGSSRCSYESPYSSSASESHRVEAHEAITGTTVRAERGTWNYSYDGRTNSGEITHVSVGSAKGNVVPALALTHYASGWTVDGKCSGGATLSSTFVWGPFWQGAGGRVPGDACGANRQPPAPPAAPALPTLP